MCGIERKTQNVGVYCAGPQGITIVPVGTSLRCKLNNTRWAQIFLGRATPNIYPTPEAEKTNLNVENTGVKCAFSPDVVSDVTMFVATDVEAHGIPTGAARSA